MFVLTALVYPCVLALLCMGAGLLADRASGGWLPGMLMPAVGAATLIATSQLSTYITFAARATPYAIAIVAIAGYALGWAKLKRLTTSLWGSSSWRERRWQLAVGALAYLIALAPILVAGRPSFSSYQALTDSAFHMLGADYLMRHGQEYAHLDLRNSYGQYLHAYYYTGYPSGADTLFGGSSFLLGLPLIWTFQPFNAFMLATATGPAWVLGRRMGIAGNVWAALAALTATLSALVYGYELVASVKEIVALSMILTLGGLVVVHERWLWRRTGVVAAAIVLAAGVSALGVGFGAWGLAAAVVLGVIAVRDVLAGRRSALRLLELVALAGAVLLVCGLSTWVQLADSLHVAQAIASTGNPGNVGTGLGPVQALGTWLSGSYERAPTGGLLALSYAISAITLIMAALGALRVVYLGEYALAGWIAAIVAVGIGLTAYATTWVDAKTIMLSSPVLVLLAWGGIAGLRASAGSTSRRSDRRAGRPSVPAAAGRSGRDSPGPGVGTSTRRSAPRLAPQTVAVLAAATLVGGIGVSDAMQYHTSNLAPTARYEELASIDRRFAGDGPALFTDFDEYALYELRDLDVGGLNFSYPPVGLRMMQGHGYPIDLDRVPPAALSAYPLIVTRRDPTVSDPPSAYRLEWQGRYYQVWARRPRAPAAIVHLGLSNTHPVECTSVERLARIAEARGGQLVAASPPETVMIDLDGAHHPSWKYTHPGLEMTGAGKLLATFDLPYAGVWDVWLKGELMPSVSVSVDGHALSSIGGELDGNPHNPDTMAPLRVTLAAGVHRLEIVRGGSNLLAPGDGGWAIVHQIFLTPADMPDVDTLTATPPARWRTLCGRRLDWIEVTRG
jgi:hypothetical protein